MRRVALVVVSIAVSMVGFVAVSVRVVRPVVGAGAEGPTVTITASGCPGGGYFCFSPSLITIANGATVTWSNHSGTEHTVSRCDRAACGVTGGTGTDTTFASADVAFADGTTVTHTFHGPGTYVYYCMIHGYALMHGTVTVTGPPSAPSRVSARPGNATATVHWAPPASNNGASISAYVVTPYVGTVAQTSRTFKSTVTTETVTGLTNGRAYTFRVAAHNSFGTGPRSALSSPIRVGTPLAPTNVSAAHLARGELKVTFTPAANNGAAITHYTATCKSTNGGTTASHSNTASPIRVTALTAAKTYTCTVTATNSRGTGPASNPSTPAVA
jgi:plastocyanin